MEWSLQKSMMELEKCRMEMQGIEPHASRMLSEHSTIWGTSLIGFCSYDIVSYCMGSMPSKLELHNMLGRVRFGFGFMLNLNKRRIPWLEPKQVEKTWPMPI